MDAKTNRYVFVHDPDQVHRFEKTFLDYHDPQEKDTDTESRSYVICQGVRKKYDPTVRVKKGFFNRREYRTGGSRDLLQSLKHYEVPLGCYTDDDGKPLNINSMVLYVSLNPRDLRKAAYEVGKTIMEEFYKGGVPNLISRSKSELQRHALKKYFMTIDLDDKGQYRSLQCELRMKTFPAPHAIIETRGGYHLIYRTSELTSEQKQFVFRDLSKRPKIDVFGDTVCPVPGTYQGGFAVHFVDP